METAIEGYRLAAFKTLCEEIRDITRHDAARFPQVRLLGKDCYFWKGYVVKSSPGDWNFKTRHEGNILRLLQEQGKGDFFPKLVADASVADRQFLLLQYIPSADLRHLFYKRHWNRIRLFAGVIRSIFDQMEGILGCLRDLGIAHRDITPDNLLFNMRRRKLYLIDFGFAVARGKEVEIKNAKEEELLQSVLKGTLGGEYKNPNLSFGCESDRYSFEKILKELKEMSPWD